MKRTEVWDEAIRAAREILADTLEAVDHNQIDSETALENAVREVSHLEGKMNQYARPREPSFYERLGRALVTIMESDEEIPDKATLKRRIDETMIAQGAIPNVARNPD